MKRRRSRQGPTINQLIEINNDEMMASSRSTAGQKDKFKNLSKTELLDRLERQKNLLANTKFISKLPDKGEKIRLQKTRLELALAQHGDVDETTNLFQRLKLGQPKVHDSKDLDSDDDVPESHSSRVPTPPPTDQDRIDKQQKNVALEKAPHASNGAMKSESTTSQELFAIKLTQRMEPDSGRPAHLLYHFMPNRGLRTTKIADVDPKHVHVDKPKVWYETAVTPPPPTFNEARLIPLKDSYNLAKQLEEKLRELAIIQATNQLALHTAVVDSTFQESHHTLDVLEDENSDEDLEE